MFVKDLTYQTYLEWNIFRKLTVHVDIVLAFPFNVSAEDYQYRMKSRLCYPIAKSNRHVETNDTYSLKSICKIQAQVMRTFPKPIRQGFITAKAVRLSTVCAPGFDSVQFKLTEALTIEDYITSHALTTVYYTN